MEIALHINGELVGLDVTPGAMLIDTLREEAGLTGSKKGCATGDCGACTVLMDGVAVTSCLVLSATAVGKEILTIEGLAGEDGLHPVQQGFIDFSAAQCGYCTPGMVMMTTALLTDEPHPSIEQIKVGLSGNLCRCTGYSKIVDAVNSAALMMGEEG